ncbi:Dehydrodolichyl diphosphate synthase complex subunit NUS1 [Rhynchospora pubera]|uniref:ditrans,polycis-polyprenyl diphosphate synthase [(2E,6E)-farnesyldiphosphate specific] n=1 Tax=Rhynchospora pubera TaxID=906938 RepID=A0AAV8BWH7_9POAL|nr:Dehydrodolichyl diphosphate synthase complex subunit NUS1 [Rhynchospora pubera]
MIEASVIASPFLGIFFCLLHVIVSLVRTWSYLVHQIQCLIISSGLLPQYQNINLDRLRHLAVVIDSEDAKNKSKVHQLLCWLSDIGVKYVILYDIEGVIKKSDKAYKKSSANPSETKCLDFAPNMLLIFDMFGMTVEIIFYTDEKEAAAKGANYLCSNYLKNQDDTLNKLGPKFTEPDISSALKAVGHDGPEPDLLLVYGPARCHLGFPAWRLRYTEIVHMGPLTSMNLVL